jgi:hypothetical protein
MGKTIQLALAPDGSPGGEKMPPGELHLKTAEEKWIYNLLRER